MSSKYRIGSIARCVGIKGEVVINPDTFDINRYFKLKSVLVGRTADKAELLSVETVRVYKQRPIIKFTSVDSRNDAEKLVDKILYVDEEDRIELPEGYFFIHDLVGMRVYTVDDLYIGEVTDVLSFPAHTIYVVSDKEKEIMIPAVDEFIDLIDEEKKIIRIKPIEGLLE